MQGNRTVSAGASNAAARQAHAGAAQRVKVTRPQCDVAVPAAPRLSSAMTRSVHGGLAPRKSHRAVSKSTCMLPIAARSHVAPCGGMHEVAWWRIARRAGRRVPACAQDARISCTARYRGHGISSACAHWKGSASTRSLLPVREHGTRLFDINVTGDERLWRYACVRARTHARCRPELLVRHRCHSDIAFCRGAPSRASRAWPAPPAAAGEPASQHQRASADRTPTPAQLSISNAACVTCKAPAVYVTRPNGGGEARARPRFAVRETLSRPGAAGLPTPRVCARRRAALRRTRPKYSLLCGRAPAFWDPMLGRPCGGGTSDAGDSDTVSAGTRDAAQVPRRTCFRA
ncbi:hypothetical protein HYPSUDRAFT_537863 [Hypholoma sublateritium FD-334 SS-4]|uniref:Uncharacterized protein n=1 Tax=Hypholoma sublateritium (strain FD-334 SS-4) TaxID=945553 RepID=A0A0D2LAJ2_HYPSF|nr:hypothetical protein HYPSUDRAFT_537863 [Hypholoma sublateritium FD-334 SS-4]